MILGLLKPGQLRTHSNGWTVRVLEVDRASGFAKITPDPPFLDQGPFWRAIETVERYEPAPEPTKPTKEPRT